MPDHDEQREAKRLIASIHPQLLGDRIKRARTTQGISIRSLAAKAGISKTSLVSCEQGKTVSTKTIVQICAALGLHLEGLISFREASPVVLHQKKDDKWYDMTQFGNGPLNGDGKVDADARSQFASQGMDVALLYLKNRLDGGKILPSVLEVHAWSEPRSHIGEEMIYILKGKAILSVAGEKHELQEGEAATFWSAEEHCYGPIDAAHPPLILSIRIDYSTTDNR
ncbi:MAG: XRE family transcriptional regulator [Fimbriimonadaceae bacterium]